MAHPAIQRREKFVIGQLHAIAAMRKRLEFKPNHAALREDVIAMRKYYKENAAAFEYWDKAITALEQDLKIE